MSDSAAARDLLVASLALWLEVVDRDLLRDILNQRSTQAHEPLETVLIERSGKPAGRFETLRHEVEVRLRGDVQDALSRPDLAALAREVAFLPRDPAARDRLARGLPVAELGSMATLADLGDEPVPDSLFPTMAGEGTIAPSILAEATLGEPAAPAPTPPAPTVVAESDESRTALPVTSGPAADEDRTLPIEDSAGPSIGTQMDTHHPTVTLEGTRDFVEKPSITAEPALPETQAEVPMTAMPTAELDVTGDFATGAPTEPLKSDRKPAPARPSPAATPAARFQIITPHAKGGLGAIFRALDVEMNREVALKEIHTRFAGHPVSQAQFRFEAEVTGGLEHPGIVPVYALGHYPDGRPYYAMRFIRGETLQKVIEQFYEQAERLEVSERELQFRQLLRRFVDVCLAIDYAHSRMVLHRDIKPANIMIGPYGETLVVDWGLAKPLDIVEAIPDGDVAAGSGSVASTPSARTSGSVTALSLSERPLRPTSGSQFLASLGSAVGTPGYMSPEQAEGDSPEIGPGTDIYALGVTLYIILTGTRPFLEKGILAIIDKTRRGEFAPPGAARAGVPKPLEAICLKAMALKPADRYLSARALATDVERWLADEPVSVYQEPPLAIAARWARRHKTFSASALVLLVTGLASLAIGYVLIRAEKARTERNYVLARRSVEEMLNRVGLVSLADVPQMEEVRRALLEKAALFYIDFLKDRQNDLALDAEAIKAQVRLADIDALLGRLAESEPRYRDAVRRARRLAAAPDAPLESRRARGNALHGLGLVLKKTGALDEARDTLKEALGVRQGIVKDPAATDEDRKALADTRFHYAALLARQGVREAPEIRESYDAAVSELQALAAKNTPDAAPDLARALNNYGKFLWLTGKDGKAEALIRKAIADLQARLAASPGSAADRWQLGRLRSNLGVLLTDESQGVAGQATLPTSEPGPARKAALTQAETLERDSENDFARLAGDFPKIPDYRREEAFNLRNLGELLREQKGRDEAVKSLERARAIYKGLAQEAPPTLDDSLGLAAVTLSLAAASSTTDPARSEDLFAEADAILARLLSRLPNVAEATKLLGTVRSNHALLRLTQKKAGAARPLIERAIELHLKALQAYPNDPQLPPELARDYLLLANACIDLGDVDGAVAAAKAFAKVSPEDRDNHLRAATQIARAVALVQAETSADEASRKQRADAMASAAVAQLRDALRLDPKAIAPASLDRPFFAPLKGRESFEAFRRELTERARPK